MKILYNTLMTIAMLVCICSGICIFFYVLFYLFADQEHISQASVWPLLFDISLLINGLAFYGWLDNNAHKFKAE